MKKIAAVSLFLLFINFSSAGTYSGGNGSAGNPYQIATKADLLSLAPDINDYNQCFILTADVNMTGQVFATAIIAADTLTDYVFQGTAFTGTFDGGNHKITNFTINDANNWNLGLFGKIDSGGTVKNLGLENCAVSSSTGYSGSLAGVNFGNISNCYSTGTVSGAESVGGLVGRTQNSNIINSYSTGLVNGGFNAGGLAGWCQENNIINCHSTSDINATGYYVGGLVGRIAQGSINNCYSTGTVSSPGYVGGLVGYNDSGAAVKSCYATGNVSSDSWMVGGLVGVNSGSIVSCHAGGDVSGIGQNVGGLVGYNYSTITSSYADGSVTGSFHVGGLAGANEYTILYCHSSGNVTGSYYIGGLVGNNVIWGTVTSSYAAGNVSGDYAFGGLVGLNSSNPFGYPGVISCYATGSVSGLSYYSYHFGGLVGVNQIGVVSSYSTGSVSGSYYYADSFGGFIGVNQDLGGASNCFWDTQTSGMTCGVGNMTNGAGCGLSDGVTGKNTSDMKTQSTFTDAGWDFLGETDNGTNDTWRMCVDGINYPKFYWQHSFKGDLDCPDGVRWDDLLYLSQRWLGTTNPFEGADITGDSIINFCDYAVLADHWFERTEIYY